MKRLSSIVIGMLLFSIIGFMVVSGVSQYQVRILFLGQGEIEDFSEMYVIIFLSLVTIGGFLGDLFYTRQLTNRSKKNL